MQGVQQALAERGFAVLRGLLRPAEVVVLSRAFDRMLVRARALGGPGVLGGARFVSEAAPFRLHRVVWAAGVEPSIEALGADRRFVGLARAALGGAEVLQLISQAHYKLPGDGVRFAWHQDGSNRRMGTEKWHDVVGNGSFLQCAVAVDKSDAQNGGLGFIPGSHKLGFIADVQTGALPDGCFDVKQAVVPELDAGDVVVFGPYVIHGSAPNESGEPRRLLLQGYAAAGANGRVYPGCGLGKPRR